MSRSFYVWASFHYWEISSVTVAMSLCLTPSSLCAVAAMISPTPLTPELSFTDNIANASFLLLSLSSLKTNSLSQEAIFIKCRLGLYVREKEATYLFAVLYVCVYTCLNKRCSVTLLQTNSPHVPVGNLTESHWVTQKKTQKKRDTTWEEGDQQKWEGGTRNWVTYEWDILCACIKMSGQKALIMHN